MVCRCHTRRSIYAHTPLACATPLIERSPRVEARAGGARPRGDGAGASGAQEGGAREAAQAQAHAGVCKAALMAYHARAPLARSVGSTPHTLTAPRIGRERTRPRPFPATPRRAGGAVDAPHYGDPQGGGHRGEEAQPPCVRGGWLGLDSCGLPWSGGSDLCLIACTHHGHTQQRPLRHTPAAEATQPCDQTNIGTSLGHSTHPMRAVLASLLGLLDPPLSIPSRVCSYVTHMCSGGRP